MPTFPVSSAPAVYRMRATNLRGAADSQPFVVASGARSRARLMARGR